MNTPDNLSYDVRIWSIRTRTGKRRDSSGKVAESHVVRWTVAGTPHQKTHATKKLAESFRAKLMTAAREGVPFERTSGLPQTMARAAQRRSWFQHATEFVDTKWPHASPRHRKNIAEALTGATLGMLPRPAGAADLAKLRRALRTWAFNKAARSGRPAINARPPEGLASSIRWVMDNSPELGELRNAQLLRKALDALAVKLDGGAAAPATIARKRSALYSALEFAVELDLLDANPIDKLSWTMPEHTDVIDRRVVANPAQARSLIEAVAEIYPPLEAFFGCLYYSALRPSEAARLDVAACTLPEADGEWGELLLPGSTQHAGSAWTDSGRAREDRSLKHRPARETRPVPAPPELVTLLRRHLDVYGAGPGGRLFVSRAGRFGRPMPAAYSNPVSSNTYARVWQQARGRALSETEVASQLARRPYDLRHAAVSLWLNAGVPATQVAEWAGHSVNVLLRVYAKCIDGQDHAAKVRIEAALRSYRHSRSNVGESEALATF